MRAKTMTKVDLELLASRYVDMWNEADPVRRRTTIRSLFSDDVAHFTKSQEAYGHAGMEQRVIGSHDKWVRDGGCEFRVIGQANGHHDVVRFGWQMVPAGGGGCIAVGSDVVVLAEDGRIRLDYQFNEPIDGETR
jgi:hypothetical protein